MIDKKLLETIKIINTNLNKKHNYDSKNMKILAGCTKLQEEAWELSGEVLTFLKIARKKKIENFKFEDLESEFADVVLSLLVLADDMWVDINKAIQNKLDKIENRWGV